MAEPLKTLVSQWQLHVGSAEPMMLPPVPIVPPPCMPIAENRTVGPNGVGIMREPHFLFCIVSGLTLTDPSGLIVLRALENGDLALGIKLS